MGHSMCFRFRLTGDHRSWASLCDQGMELRSFYYYYCNISVTWITVEGENTTWTVFWSSFTVTFLTVMSVIPKDIKWCFEIFFYASIVYFDWKLPSAWIVLWSTALPYFENDSCVFTKCHCHYRSDTVFVYNIYTSLCTKVLNVISFNKQVALLQAPEVLLWSFYLTKYKAINGSWWQVTLVYSVHYIV